MKSGDEWRRAYGSLERVFFVAWALPCVVPGCRLHERHGCQNHHWRTGGMGRKADSTEIVPLCKYHHDKVHLMGRQSFEEYFDVDLEKEAEYTETEWKHNGEIFVRQAKRDGRYDAWQR